MKICFISSYPTPNDGVSDYTRDVVEALKQTGVEVETLKINNPLSLKSWAEWRGIWRKVQAIKPDVVHIQYTPTSLGFRIKWFLKQLHSAHLPVVLTVHEKPDFFIDRLPRLLVKPYLRWERSVFQIANSLMVHTKDQFVDIRIRYDIPGTNITTIPHYVQDTPAHGSEQVHRLVVLGRIVPKKRLDIVIEAVQLLKVEFPDIKLLVIGQAPNRYSDFAQHLKQLVTIHGLDSLVEWKGYVAEEKLAQLLSPTDVGVLPYLMGTQSGAAFKLLSYNLPLITSQLPAFVELTRQYPVGRAEDLSTPELLAQAIRELFSHPELKDVWQAGIQRLKKEQSLDTIAKLHLTLYTYLCQNTLE